MNTNLVLFLGAGFSNGFANKPVVEKLLEAMLKEIPEDEKNLIIETIKRIFPSLSDPSKADFEILLGIIASLKKNKIDSNKILGNIDVEHVWRVLISSLGKALHYSLSYEKNYTDPDMKALIDILKGLQENYSISVITTNYDLIVDKAVGWIIDRELGYKELNDWPVEDLRRWTYEVPIRRIWGNNSFKPCRYPWNPFEQGIKIYKLHGSLNWAYCERCDSLDLSYDKHDLESIYSIKDISCPTGCGGKYSWVILPPMHVKEYENPIFKKIWMKAEDILANAQYVVFIGYGLPEADPFVAQLILKGYSKSNSTCGTPWKYWIINKEEKISERFEKLFNKSSEKTKTPYKEFAPQTFKELLKRNNYQIENI